MSSERIARGTVISNVLEVGTAVTATTIAYNILPKDGLLYKSLDILIVNKDILLPFVVLLSLAYILGHGYKGASEENMSDEAMLSKLDTVNRHLRHSLRQSRSLTVNSRLINSDTFRNLPSSYYQGLAPSPPPQIAKTSEQ